MIENFELAPSEVKYCTVGEARDGAILWKPTLTGHELVMKTVGLQGMAVVQLQGEHVGMLTVSDPQLSSRMCLDVSDIVALSIQTDSARDTHLPRAIEVVYMTNNEGVKAPHFILRLPTNPAFAYVSLAPFTGKLVHEAHDGPQQIEVGWLKVTDCSEAKRRQS